MMNEQCPRCKGQREKNEEKERYYLHDPLTCIRILRNRVHILEIDYVTIVYVNLTSIPRPGPGGFADKTKAVAGVFTEEIDNDWIKQLENKYGVHNVSLEKIQLNWKRFTD